MDRNRHADALARDLARRPPAAVSDDRRVMVRPVPARANLVAWAVFVDNVQVAPAAWHLDVALRRFARFDAAPR